MKTIIRFFNDDTHELLEVDCSPTDTQDAADVRQDHIDRLWEEEDRAQRFDGVEWL